MHQIFNTRSTMIMLSIFWNVKTTQFCFYTLFLFCDNLSCTDKNGPQKEVPTIKAMAQGTSISTTVTHILHVYLQDSDLRCISENNS